METQKEKIIPVYIEEEVKNSYLNYAMSVIVGRALPDVRDGLKPVHRRVLYAMKELNLEHDKPYKKCARVVGTVLGQYHPHGDIAVYDTLVRMAQDFSLRYPLVDGQGNFGCFTKDTKIRLSDGRNLSFEELIKESQQGKKNYTFSLNPQTQKIEIAEIKNPRKTRKDAALIKIILDNGKEIKCTPDHLFMLRDGTYKKAKDLKPKESLMALYTSLYDGENDLNLKGYEIIYQPLKENWEFIHHLADKWNLENNAYKKSAGKIRHHKDFNKLNNNPDNIQRIQWSQHWRLHKEIAAWRHKNDPEYRKKLAEGRKRFLSKPENLQKIGLRLKERNLRNWEDPAYRKKMGEIIHLAWQRPEYRERIIAGSSQNLKNLWKKKEFKELLSKLKSKELKERWRNQNYRDFITEITRKTSLRIWSDPKHRQYISRLNKERWKNLEYRHKMVEQSKNLWKDPQFRSKYSTGHFRKMAKKLWENSAIREFHRAKARQQWLNQEFRKICINSIIKRNQRRLKENPNLMSELAQKAATSLRVKWQDPLYKERVIKSKILGFVGNLLKQNQAVTPQIYETKRLSGLPKVETALKYFYDFEDLVIQAGKKYNHKVVAVKILNNREDVYDLTIEPWHNFALAAGVFVHNSVDGDSPAAMRYTEARLAAISDEMLADIDKETVNFGPNFDASLTEPLLLPAKLPNLLVNGSSGIAVGMATNMAPHNLSEVLDAATHLLDNPEAEIKELLRYIKGPDFPTAGLICGKEGIKEAYNNGKGKVTLRCRATIERQKGGKDLIVVTEIPYQVNKASLIEAIAALVEDKKIEGISDIRDESDKEGMRMVVELKRDTEPQIVLNQLYKHTQLETTFGIINLALVEGRPRLLNLKQLLQYYIEHRKEIIRRRTKFELEKAQRRAHILEGLKIALKFLDKVIKTIRASKDTAQAKEALMKNFELSAEQAQAILEMQLQRLTALERDKLEAEYLDLIKKIELYKSILASEKKVEAIIKDESAELKKKYGDERRTEIVGEVEELEVEDLIAEEDMVITISNAGYIKRLSVSSYRKQKRGGKGVTAIEMREEDFVKHLFVASTKDYLLVFTNKGKAYWLKVYEIPESGRAAKGKAIVNLLSLAADEVVTSVVAVKEFSEDKYLIMCTQKGVIKKTKLSEFSNPRRAGVIAITIEKDDQLIEAEISEGKFQILLASSLGKSIRFKEEQVRDMGRAAKGVIGFRMAKKDKIVGMEVFPQEIDKRKELALLTVTSGGFAKRSEFSDYRLQSRGGKGIINIKVTPKNGDVSGVRVVSDDDEIMAVTQKGMIVRCPVKDIRKTGRNTQGVRLISLDKADNVVSIAKVVAKEE